MLSCMFMFLIFVEFPVLFSVTSIPDVACNITSEFICIYNKSWKLFCRLSSCKIKKHFLTSSATLPSPPPGEYLTCTIPLLCSLNSFPVLLFSSPFLFHLLWIFSCVLHGECVTEMKGSCQPALLLLQNCPSPKLNPSPQLGSLYIYIAFCLLSSFFIFSRTQNQQQPIA